MNADTKMSKLCSYEGLRLDWAKSGGISCANLELRAEMCVTLKGMAVPKCTAQTSQHRPVH